MDIEAGGNSDPERWDLKVEPLDNLIADLIRAANGVLGLGEFERARLLDRAYRGIRYAREVLGVQQDSLDRDSAIDFLTMSRSVQMFSDNEIKAALLEATGMIRDLRMTIEARAEAILREALRP
ncbi:hypothetical protein M0654_03870 [Rhizobium sp. NTR19]|uniref:Uncharacterized protein n=1 Tax=Neorhizobium turbinariae TaxID=2937795 RepID=A0ABT0IML4_9HYPH|nr:hypothetical protein [Neorhizobium turbinariae]MCK8779117.1 hypothetical protein [Neorhizobium turbinariae]